MSELQEFCDVKKVRIVSSIGVRKSFSELDEWQRQARAYTCRLEYSGRRLTCDFFMGKGHVGEPSTADVLSCLITDSTAAESTFEQWCHDFGYDSDSISQKKLYDACVKSSGKVHTLLGDEFDEFASMPH
jgi:hypothetical protein